MLRFVPIGIAVVAIVALTVVDGQMTSRWGDGLHAAYSADLLKEVPMEFGSWVGEDQEVDALVRDGAGARGYVSRVYKNERNGKQVSLWLISGHGRDVLRHTPDVCYPSAGQKPEEPYETHTAEVGESGSAEFRVGLFSKAGPTGQEVASRVLWTWFAPDEGSGEKVVWQAPEGRRYKLGGVRSLYKMYFTCLGSEALKPVDKSVCLDFAAEFLPVVEPILRRANGEVPAGYEPSADVAEAI